MNLKIEVFNDLVSLIKIIPRWSHTIIGERFDVDTMKAYEKALAM